MKENLPHFTLRISQNLLDKIGYIAEYDGRTKNKEIEHLIKQKVKDFESEHGKIDLTKLPDEF